MAYMNQERKNSLAPAIKALCRIYGVKCTLGVNNHSTLVVNLSEGKLDIIGNYFEKYKTDFSWKHPNEDIGEKPTHIQVNEFHIPTFYSGKVEEFLTKLVKLCNLGNHDNSDIQTDYFDVGWYLNINVGKWNKPYQVTK